jgi:S-formylglutathione hydrolase FrmB
MNSLGVLADHACYGETQLPWSSHYRMYSYVTRELPALVAAKRSGQSLNLRMLPGYDRDYYFIQTFMADHLRHHAAHLR